MNFWPEPYRAAISLTFDDGLRSQQEIALPALDQRGLRATFYLNPRGKDEDPGREETWEEYLRRWLPAHRQGHEIGNHTILHPCSLNIDVDGQWKKRGTNLLGWTLEQMEADMLEAQRRIMAVFPGQQHTSFAYPCYESTVGRGAGRVSYVPLVAKHFSAGRAKGELSAELANDPLYCDVHHLSSWPVERHTGAFMIGLVEGVLAQGRWGVFTFHGIQEGHLPIGDGDLIELLDHLARRKEEVWVAPVAEVGKFVKSSHNV